jgi:hypothetical protein
MQEIMVQYRPFGWLLKERTIKGSFPEKWEELTEKQFIAIANLSETDDLSRLLSLFSGLPSHICRRLDHYQQTELWRINDWIKEAPSCNRFFIPVIRAGHYTLHSPQESLRKVTFGRFIFFDTAFVSYQFSQDTDDLNRFIVSLYIPANFTFSDDLLLTMEPCVKEIPEKLKQAILFNYSLVRRWLAEIYPLIFSLPRDKDGIDENPDGKKPSGRAPDSRAWIKVFENIVGDDIANHDRYADIPLHNVLRYLTAKAKENAKYR